MKTEFEVRNGELYVKREVAPGNVVPQLWRHLPEADRKAMERDLDAHWAAELKKHKEVR